MERDQLKKHLLKDDYINIAFKRYLAFKETEEYDEKYKIDILSELNAFLRETDINSDTVYDIVKRIQKANPSSGSFVHWSNTDDLVQFAENRPDVVAQLLTELYEFTGSFEQTIESFREKGKEFKPTISLGAPLFGYLLAAKDYTLYPLYKQEVFVHIKNTYGIESKLGTVGNNYETYLNVCTIALHHLQQSYPELTMLVNRDIFHNFI